MVRINKDGCVRKASIVSGMESNWLAGIVEAGMFAAGFLISFS